MLSQLKLDYSRFLEHHSQNLSEGTEKNNENQPSAQGMSLPMFEMDIFGIQGVRLPGRLLCDSIFKYKGKSVLCLIN
jgi:hypothetical protein